MTDTKHAANRTASTRSSARASGVAAASPQEWLGSNNDPDVMLSVPDLTIDKLVLQVKELRADVDLQARVLDLLDLRVGARVTLGEVDLDIENVSAKAMLKVRLDKVAEVVEKVMDAISENPELVTSALNISVATDPELAASDARTVRSPALTGLLGGVLGAEGAELRPQPVQAVARVEHDGPAKTARRKTTKKAPRASTTRAHRTQG